MSLNLSLNKARCGCRLELQVLERSHTGHQAGRLPAFNGFGGFSPDAGFTNKSLIETDNATAILSSRSTVKPVAMVADAILDCTERGDIVLDPFLGSGTSLMAAERTGRCCYGLELDPLYADVIVRRWQTYTGGIARHVATGATFDEIAAVRAEAAEALS